MDPLRIAVALPHLGVYGGIRRFLELGRVWTSRGHEVALLTPGGGAVERPWLPFPGQLGSLEELKSRSWDVLLSPDPVLFLQSKPPGALRVFYAVLEGAPRAREAWRSADLVIANSLGMARHVARNRVRAVHAPGGVNTEFFRPPDPDPRPQRAMAGEPARILVYGRLSRKRKGSWTAIRAVEAAAAASGAAVTLTLFDAPPSGAPTPTLGRALAVPHEWALDPTQDELRALYGAADLFVSAERRAGWSNTSAEAMACGAAVVCTRSGTEDFAENGVTAAVARWPWTWLLARKIAPLLLDREARLALAARGRERIGEFTWERTADRIERALVEALARRKR
jgi:glycosyltransferase involved in cell wall biosynthesis